MAKASRALAAAGIEDAARDARVLMAHFLNISKDRLTLYTSDEITVEQEAGFAALVEERLRRRPVSKIVGGREFYGRTFNVSDDVLDPRPDTETLIDCALSISFSKFLDLGTGSGAIAVTLLAERPDALGTATDVSKPACAIATLNADRHVVIDRLDVKSSNWFEQIEGKFDLIVSNPPYIAADEMLTLAPEVRDFDPHLALTDHGDGLGCYRAIIPNAINYLQYAGWLMLEIGPTQADAVVELMAGAGFANVTVVRDIDGRNRVIKGQYCSI